jgi:hypothetical protein
MVHGNKPIDRLCGRRKVDVDMKTMADLELFKKIDGMTGTTRMLRQINLGADALDLDAIEDQLRTINRRFPFQMKSLVMDDVQRRRVIPVWNPEKLVLPVAANAFLWRNSATGSPVAVVNLSHYGRMVKGEGPPRMEIDNRALFSLLQYGSVLLGSFNNWNKLSMSIPVLKNGVNAWVRMTANVLDKMYGVSLQPMRYDLLCYCLAKYYLVGIMGKADGSDTVEGLAAACAPNGTSRALLQGGADEAVKPEEWTSVIGFFQALANIEGLGSMTTRGLLENYQKAYGEASLLGLEYFPTFASTVFSSQVGGGVVKDFQVEQAAGRFGENLYVETHRIIGSVSAGR